MAQGRLVIPTVLVALLILAIEATSQQKRATTAKNTESHDDPATVNNTRLTDGWASSLVNQLDRYVLTGNADHGRVEAAVQEARQFLARSNLTLDCSSQVLALAERVSSRMVAVALTTDPEHDWAFKLLDANARPSSGNLAGRAFWLGAFDQCMDISVILDNNKSVGHVSVAGKYCLSHVKIQQSLISTIPVQLDEFNSTLKIASCWPSSCTTHDFRMLLKEFHSPLFDESDVNVLEHLCQTKNDSMVDATSVILLLILIVPIVLVLLSTSYDYLDLYRRRKNKTKTAKAVSDLRRYALDTCSRRRWLFLIFSCRQSGLKLIDASHDDTDVSCIYGLRFFNIVWLISLQVGSFIYRDYPWDNHGQVFNVKDKLIIPYTMGATYATDSYLFISGFCLVYIVLELVENWKEQKTKNILLLGLARFLRLTPSYIFVVMAMAGPIAWLYSGPLWSQVITERDHCRSGWWTNILYVNNFALSYKMQCLKTSWYLSLDFQCYLLALPLLIFLTKKPEIARNVLLILMLMSCVTVGVLIGQFQMEQFFGGRFTFEIFSEYFTYMLTVPWTRIGVFFMGMVVAHKTHQARVNGFKMKLSTYMSGWIMTALVFAALIFGPLPYSTGDIRMHRAIEVLYGVACRPLFGAMVGWTVFACATGYGGFLNKILSEPVWRRLGRLTFCMYLVHEPALMLIFWTVRTNVNLTIGYLVFAWLGSLVVTIKTAILLFVVVEAPLSGVRHALFTKFVRPPPRDASVETDPLNTYNTFAAPHTANDLMREDCQFGIATSTDDEEEEFSVADVRVDQERKEIHNFSVGP